MSVFVFEVLGPWVSRRSFRGISETFESQKTWILMSTFSLGGSLLVGRLSNERGSGPGTDSGDMIAFMLRMT